MKDEEGEWVRSHGEIVAIGVRHFQNIYKQPKRVNIANIVKLASFFLLLCLKNKM